MNKKSPSKEGFFLESNVQITVVLIYAPPIACFFLSNPCILCLYLIY